MADKLTPLILAALTRAAAEPAGVAVVALKAEPGLFPNTALAKAAAKRCLDEHLLRRVATPAGVERCAITPKGMAFLLEVQNPKAVLEDLVRVFEQRQGQVDDLVQRAAEMAESLRGLQGTLDAVLPKVAAKRVAVEPDLTSEIMAALAGRSEDCPLPELFRSLPSKPSLGAFHDALRKLHAHSRVYLHPWTGPLYTLPEPSFALLAGHEVAYYASAQAAPPRRFCEASLTTANSTN